MLPLIFLKKRFSGLQNLNVAPANNSLQRQSYFALKTTST